MDCYGLLLVLVGTVAGTSDFSDSLNKEVMQQLVSFL